MKVALFYPPVGNICQPYLSTPALVAYLKQNGVADVRQYDLNVEAVDELLTPSRLKRAYRWSYHYLRKQEMTAVASDIQAFKRQLALHAMLVGPRTIESIDEAKRVFRTAAFYDRAKYQQALGTLRDAFQLLSTRYFPTVINHQGFTMKYRLDSSEEILAAVGDGDENCFIPLFRQRLEELFGTDGVPDLAGISIGYYEQLIPGLTLASLIKRLSPQTHVTVGGTMMSALYGKELQPKFFTLFDSVVFFEGEVPLLALIRALENGARLDDVPSLMFSRNGKITNTPICSEPLALDSVPTPDFTGLPLSKYFSPGLILPISGSRGCYWRKCAFCTRQHLIDSYRKVSAERIVAEIERLRERYDAQAFFFVDECFSPAALNRVAYRLLAAGTTTRWTSAI